MLQLREHWSHGKLHIRLYAAVLVPLRALSALRLVGASVVALLLCIGCADSRLEFPPDDPRELVLGLRSFTTLEDACKVLGVNRNDLTVVDDSYTPPSEARPSLRTQGYALPQRFGENDGTLRLLFVNGLLSGVWFFPKTITLPLDSFDEGVRRPAPVEFRVGHDHSRLPYVSWEDARLTRYVRDWIDRYA
jgi:hypothetical protein